VTQQWRHKTYTGTTVMYKTKGNKIMNKIIILKTETTTATP
jgi:hypothetical protein